MLCTTRRVVGSVSSRSIKAIVCKDVRNGRKTVVGLCRWNVVNVAGLAQAAGAMLRMASVWITGTKSGERLVKRRGLDNSVVGKLFCGRRIDRQTRRGTFPS